ncbi:motility associated factor glycosyltransferase family protein [Desulfotomaculum copahuensis]|uniref:DUF115 domain-containing protein n=1 Tax=Desulfotomaculum copahuensis TaxID=1838280 RepID=A0A1B7LCK1_9FIRM|nr:6-hydroxymethylpterin diphosphokinase MptE-like protein [Desulfotomaculum copahuensis]OAT80390.1 hypothetical protein A6M21_13570 [Desulfotomaculum copahuensis]
MAVNKAEPNIFDIYQANIKALSGLHPELARRVEAYRFKGAYRAVVTDEKQPVINLELPGTNTYYYRPEDPLGDVYRQLQSQPRKNNLLAVMMGFGLGYQVSVFLQHFAAAQHTRFLAVIEQDMELFKTALYLNNLAPLFMTKGVVFFVGLDGEELYLALRRYLEENQKFILLRTMKPVYYLTPFLGLQKDYYLRAANILWEAGAHQMMHYGDSPQDSLIGVKNMLDNLDVIIDSPGINLLYDKFKNRPAVIVATGPSLNKNKHLLKGLENRALMISVDASLKVLMEMGVRPHMVTSLERVPAVRKLIDGFRTEEVRDVYLAACPVICQEVYAAYPGPKIIVYRNFDHFRWIEIERGILDTGPSSANMAFKVAEALGCNPIILLGQDLAFGADGLSHAAGTPYGTQQEPVENRSDLLAVPGNNGQLVLTTPTWYRFLKYFEQDIANYSGECLNCTEGGARIAGTKVMPLQDAVDRYMREQFDPAGIICAATAGFQQNAAADRARVRAIIADTRRAMQNVVDECSKGLDAVAEYAAILHQVIQESNAGGPENTAVKAEDGSDQSAAAGGLSPEQMAAAGAGAESHQTGATKILLGEINAPGDKSMTSGTADESFQTGAEKAAPGRGTAPAWPESAERDALARIAAEILKHKETCITAHPSFQLFFTHIFQSFMIRFEMEMCAVSEKYASEQAAKAEMLLRQAEWFTAARDLAMACVEMLRNI